MESFPAIVNSFQSLTITAKLSILVVCEGSGYASACHLLSQQSSHSSKCTLSTTFFYPRCCHLTSHIAPALSNEFLDIQTTMECRFTLKCVSDMIITYSQMHHTDKYSHHSSIIWPVWLNG